MVDESAGVAVKWCDVCRGELRCGQPGRHFACMDQCTGCRRPAVIRGDRRVNCHCKGKTVAALNAAKVCA